MSRDTIIHLSVPAQGAPLSLVLQILEVRRCQVRPWLGGELGAPRDYSWPKGALELWFTPAGIRNLAELVGQEIVVMVQKREGMQ